MSSNRDNWLPLLTCDHHGDDQTEKVIFCVAEKTCIFLNLCTLAILVWQLQVYLKFYKVPSNDMRI
jgi:hypothetical protein